MIRNLAGFILCVASLLASAHSQISTRTAQLAGGIHQLSENTSSQMGTAQTAVNKQLGPAAQAQISAAIGRDQSTYHFVARSQGFHAENPNNGLAAEFTPAGVDFHSGSNQWSLALTGYGYGEKLLRADRVAPHASANRLEYERGPVSEWYVNGPAGVEQGFTLAKAPGKASREPLTLAFALSGDLKPAVTANSRDLVLKRNGSVVVSYVGLVAADARGRELPAWFEVRDAELRLRVVDDGAQYPLTIDPMVQAHKLINALSGCSVDSPCPDGQPNDHFGSSVAMSSDGNTVVGLVSGSVQGPTQMSLLYVFQKPSTGWQACRLGQFGCFDFVAKLTTSGKIPGLTQVGMSGDGGTIVALLGKAAYVYVKPSTGWANATETAQLTVSEQGPCCRFWPSSLSINGDGSIVTIGYTGGLFGNQGRGAVFVYTKPSGGWVSTSAETAKLMASDGASEDLLGYSVNVSSDGNTITAGAPQATVNSVVHAGAVYVFVKQAALSWGSSTQVAKLTASVPPPPTTDLGFGFDVRVDSSGDTIISTDTGYVYVFQRPACGPFCITGGKWLDATETAKLSTSDFRGVLTLGISGDGATISAGNTGGVTSTEPGAVYMYAKPGGPWVASNETQKLSASDAIPNDQFGASTALSSNGTVMVVGGPNATDGTNLNEGALYVFTGFAGTPVASVSPSTLTFGNQVEGTTSSPQIVTLANNGNAPLVIAGVVASAQFTTSQNCVLTLPPGMECTENVAFAPTSFGPVSGTLTFTDNNGAVVGSTQQVQLNGTGYSQVTSTAITSASPNPAVTAQPVVVTYKVTPVAPGTFTPSGVVVINASTGESCSGSAPAGSCAIAFNAVGSRTLIASYGGDVNFNPSTSPGVTEVVNKAATTTSVTSSLNPSFAGQSVTFTVTVAGAFGGTPSGSVMLKDGSTNLTPLTLGTGGTVQYPITQLAVGSHSISASYVGDVNFLASSGAVTQVVKKNATTTVVSSSLNPSNVGQQVTFTANVSSTGVAIPDGEPITFKYGTSVLGVGNTSSGAVSINVMTLPAGSDSVVATYPGDANFAASSGSVKQVVNKFATTTAVTSSLNPTNVGQSVTFTASVSSTGGNIPDGETITFKYGSTVLGTGTTSGGSASISTSTLPAGTDSVVATYAGGPTFATSAGTVKQVVNKFATATAITSSLNPSTVGQAVTFTASVSSTGGSIPDGDTITFKYGTTVLGTGTTSSGSASISVSTLPGGSDSVVATYAGDPTFAASTGSVKQVVNKFATTTAVTSSPNPSTSGTMVAFRATVASTGGAIPDGETVTFKYGSTVLGTGTTSGGSASTSVSILPVGSDSVVATYAGDANFAVSSGTIVQKVQ